MKLSTKPAAGMRDFLPAELARRRYVLAAIRDVYRRHGFQELQTPALERIEILTGKYGDEGDQLMFKVLKRGRKLISALDTDPSPPDLSDMGLRYDQTVPLSRVMAQYRSELPRIFRAFQLQPVWRADRPAKGRFREFYQCDVDVLGTDSPLAEVEALTAASQALRRLGFDDFTIRVNDRRLLRAMATAAGIAVEQRAGALVSLDKRDKIGQDGVRDELRANGVADEAAEALFAFIGVATADSPEAGLRALAESLGEAVEADAVDHLGQLFALWAQLDTGGNLAFDASLARGLTYYTGPIFEVTVPDFASSVGGGGRYDDLVGMFLGQPVPAVGVSLGVERLMMLMEERGLFPADLVETDVLVTTFPDTDPAVPLRLAQRLRASGLTTDVYLEATRLKKQFKVAEQQGARVVAVLGPSEIEAGQVVLKHMATGDQVTVAVAGAVGEIRGWLKR